MFLFAVFEHKLGFFYIVNYNNNNNNLDYKMGPLAGYDD